jgi:alkylated DNA repair dioxygenase AlkB
MEASAWSEVLTELRVAIETFTGATFNSVLLNLYRDHRDSMGFHADDEPELGPCPTIASLSLGAERTLVFKHRTRKLAPVRINLAAGSLLVMKGETQHNWFHGIHKLTAPCGPRINLTFRKIAG